MEDQTWIKSTEGHFIAVNKVTHIRPNNIDGVADIFTTSGWSGTLPSVKAFFDAMQRGLSRAEVNG